MKDADKTDNEDEEDGEKPSKKEKKESGKRKRDTATADVKKEEETKKTEKKIPAPERLKNYRTGEDKKDQSTRCTEANIAKSVAYIKVLAAGAVFQPIQVDDDTAAQVDGCDVFTGPAPGLWVKLTEALTSVTSTLFRSVASLKQFEDQLLKPEPALGMVLARNSHGEIYLHLSKFAAFQSYEINSDFIHREYSATMPGDLDLKTECDRVDKIRRDQAKQREEETKKRLEKIAEEDKKKKESTTPSSSASTSTSAAVDARNKAKVLARALAAKRGQEWCTTCDLPREYCVHAEEEEPASKKQKTAVSSDDTVASAPSTPAASTTTSTSITTATTSPIDVTADVTPKAMSDGDDVDSK